MNESLREREIKMEKNELKKEIPEVQAIDNQAVVETPPIETPAPPEVAEETSPEVLAVDETAPAEEAGNSVMEEAAALVQELDPEADVSTPEAILTALFPFAKSMKTFHDWVNESVEIEPAAGDMLIDVKNGLTWERAIHRNFDMDELGSPEGSDDAELVKADKAERVKKYQDGLKEKADKEALWAENEEVSGKNLIAVVEEEGLDPETAQNIVNLMGKIITDAADRVISKENWKMAINGLRHESVVKEKEAEKETAFEDGKIAGKNEKIEKKRAKPEAGDGLVRLTGTAGDESKETKKTTIPTRKEFRV